jgi:predicted ribosomally synthesized six-cysteine peptide SCIFF
MPNSKKSTKKKNNKEQTSGLLTGNRLIGIILKGVNNLKHIKIIKEGKLTDVKNRGCGECQTSCQSACKTSCTVGNQKCKQTTEK